MKAFKKAIALVLCLVMTVGIFAVSGITVDDLAGLFKAEAATTIGGITQQRVVSNHESLYRSYQKRFFNGEETNWPTNFVIPGLGSSDDYTPQGMTYWKAKEWILISAYDASGSGKSSVIYALDVVTTNLVAVFKIQNADRTTNTSHGGGIAASEYNFYYADSASKVSYVPLSEMDISGGEKTIRLRDSVDFSKEMTGSETGQTVKTSYCCYDDGILWTGNFVWSGDDSYKAIYHATYQSVLMGYKLSGNSSEEEWYYLKNGYNIAKITKADGETTTTEYSNSKNSTEGGYTASINYTKVEVDGAHLEVRGTVTSNATAESESVDTTRLGEITTPSNIGSFDLVEGTQYKISFISTNKDTDIYMWAPNGKHCNVKQATTSSKRQLDDGRWYYEMIFTAGLKPTSADSLWPTTQSTDGSYTGTYSFRIDQDNVLSSYDFAVTDISVCEYSDAGITVNPDYEGVGCAGNPTHVVALDTDRIQYAMVDKGKLYVSRSWSRTQSGNHTRELMIADIDLNRPGDVTYTVNGRNHNIYLVNYDDASVTHFGGNYKESDKGVSAEELNRMLWMGEALCVIDDYLYMFGEGAAWNYNGKTSNSICGEPIDVIWKIDQYAIQGLTRPHDDVAAVEYEKVNSLSEINNVDEYIVLYESAIKDPVSQRNILYLLDSNGGYGDKKLSKKSDPSNVNAASTGDSRGIVGYEIRAYSVKEENGKTSIILNAEDDAHKSLHWQFESGSSTSLRLKNRELYFAKHPYLYVGDSLFAMTTTASSTMNIKDWGNGDFTIYGSGTNYSIWCNDGSVPESITAYTNFYSNHGQSGYVPNYHNLEETAGTFHITNSGQPALPTSEQQGLHIYKRVSDPYASSYETQVYTDLNAELTSDGTYNITLETYATDSIQYQKIERQRPTDFIFVLDLSGSMDETDAKSYYTESGWSDLAIQSITSDTEKPSSATIHGYQLRDGNIFYKTTSDGVYHPVYAAVRTTSRSVTNCTQHYWAYYISKTDGKYYMMYPDGTVSTTGITYETLKSYVDNDTNYSASVKNNYNNTRKQTVVYKGPHYEFRTDKRLSAVKNAVDSLTYKIASEANSSGLDHRIAVVSSGSDDRGPGYIWTNTGIYTNDSTALTQYTGEGSISLEQYKKAFFSVAEFGEVRSIVSSLKEDGFTYINNGLQLAGNIVEASDADYDINGTRSAVVIVISDGAAGGDTKDTINLASSTESANGALAASYELKRQGAYVFTVRVGDVTSDDDYYVDGFDYDSFMKYMSSKYMGSKSMTDIGAVNPKDYENEYDFYVHVPGGESFNLDYITDTVFNSVISNSTNAISSLTDESILREHLTDAFDLTNASIKCETAKSKYDGIGRLYFERPVTAPYNPTLDRVTNNIELTGFDYSAKNVSEYNSKLGNGEKLIITISGVIADAGAELLNTSINDTSKTAIYENTFYMGSNQPVKRFPTYRFSIPEYTYYMDYDIPMYDSDINGTLCSVDSTLKKQSTYKTSLSTGNMGIQFVNGNQDMVYTLNSQAGLTEKLSKGYVLIKRDDGSYDWFRLNIVPASTVYYEENKTDTLDGTQSFTEWTQNGSFDNKYQSLSTENDVFGSDSTYYNSTEKFSLGTHKAVTVSDSDKRSDTQTFTFTGTGFDLISACGTNTGIQTVTVKQHQDNGSMKIVKVFMVDTFYNDITYGTVYQVPVVQYKGDYATYTVETTAAYFNFAGALKTQSVDTYAVEGTDLEATTAVADTFSTDELFAQVGMDELIGQEVDLIWMDDNSVLNGGLGVEGATLYTQADGDSTKSLINYIDGFRIYNPVDYNDEYIESEKNATYYSVMETITAGGMGGDSLTAYIEPGAEGEINFGNYLTSGGPKYEVYLAPGNSIAFRFKASYGDVIPRAMVSVRAASGSPKAKFASSSNPTHAYQTDVLSGSETYYDITFNALGNGDDGSFVLTVTNTGSAGSGLLAVDNIKLTNATLVPMNGVSLAELNEMISTQAIEVDFHAVKPVTPTYSSAPADDPNIDPMGSIPTIEEYIAANGNSNDSDDSDDKFSAIIETIKSFFERIIAFFKNAFQSVSLGWLIKM